MKKEIVQTVLVCDWCGSEKNVRSYMFRRKYYDGHRNDEEDTSIELCAKCQIRAYESLMLCGSDGGMISGGVAPLAIRSEQALWELHDDRTN